MTNQEEDVQATDSLAREEVHDLLASERRRYVLSTLSAHGPLPLPDLADEIAHREHDAPLPQVPEDAVLRTYLSLWHVHVPKLREANVVSYDQESDVVALAENADRIEQFMADGAHE